MNDRRIVRPSPAARCWAQRMLAQYEETERLAARREAALDLLETRPGFSEIRAQVERMRRLLFEEGGSHE